MKMTNMLFWGVILLLISMLIGQAAAQTCFQPPTGIVCWWPGDGNATDIVDGNTGTLQGGATFATGKVCQAFSLDGIDDFVFIGNPPNLKTLPFGITIDAWVNPTATPPLDDETLSNIYAIVSKWGQDSQTDAYGLYLHNPDGNIRLLGGIGVPGESDHGLSGGVVPVGQWTYVALTYDSVTGDNKLYVNGLPVAQRTRQGGITLSDLSVLIGREDSFLPRPFQGLIDEIEIYNRALSPEEIQAIFNAGSAGKCKVAVTSADLVSNTVTVQLYGNSSTSGILTVTANGDSNNYPAITPTNAVGPGTYQVSFDRPNMPADIYTTVTAEWDIGSMPATTTFSLTNDWIVQGLIRHSQYNTPLESACTGSWQFAYVFNSSCKFNKVKLNSNFVSQVGINGHGYSTNYGIIRYCPSSWSGICATCAANRPKDATDSNAFLKVSTVTGSCLTELVAGTSVAAYPNPYTNTDYTKFYCDDAALLVKSDNTNKAVKTAQDSCPDCSGDFRGTQGHIDDYSSSQACSGRLVGDYGNFWAANTQE